MTTPPTTTMDLGSLAAVLVNGRPSLSGKQLTAGVRAAICTAVACGVPLGQVALLFKVSTETASEVVQQVHEHGCLVPKQAVSASASASAYEIRRPGPIVPKAPFPPLPLYDDYGHPQLMHDEHDRPTPTSQIQSRAELPWPGRLQEEGQPQTGNKRAVDDGAGNMAKRHKTGSEADMDHVTRPTQASASASGPVPVTPPYILHPGGRIIIPLPPPPPYRPSGLPRGRPKGWRKALKEGDATTTPRVPRPKPKPKASTTDDAMPVARSRGRPKGSKAKTKGGTVNGAVQGETLAGSVDKAKRVPRPLHKPTETRNVIVEADEEADEEAEETGSRAKEDECDRTGAPVYTGDEVDAQFMAQLLSGA